MEIETRKVLKASDRRQTRTLVRNFENLSLLTKFKFKRMDDYEKSRKLEIDALQNSEVLKRNQAMKMIFEQDFSDRNCLHYTGLMGADQAEQLDTHPPPPGLLRGETALHMPRLAEMTIKTGKHQTTRLDQPSVENNCVLAAETQGSEDTRFTRGLEEHQLSQTKDSLAT